MDPIKTEYATGNERFILKGSDSDLCLINFWAWAYSDCLTNTHRGVLAEFLVASALGIDLKQPREAWAKFDLTYRGKGVEVKSASYHQSWYQKEMSKINFVIPRTRAWDADTNRLDSEIKRQARFYVLCLLSEQDRRSVNPLDIDQWRFWVVPTCFFNDRKRSQHSIGYNSLISEVGQPVGFGNLQEKADALINDSYPIATCRGSLRG